MTEIKISDSLFNAMSASCFAIMFLLHALNMITSPTFAVIACAIGALLAWVPVAIDYYYEPIEPPQ